MPLADDINAIPGLVGDAVEQLGKLVDNEIRLARAEFAQKIAQTKLGASYLVFAAMLAIPVLVVLLIALALWLVQFGLSPPAAYLVSAVCGAIVSLGLATVGLNHLKPENLKPKVTMQQLARDVATAKDLGR